MTLTGGSRTSHHDSRAMTRHLARTWTAAHGGFAVSDGRVSGVAAVAAIMFAAIGAVLVDHRSPRVSVVSPTTVPGSKQAMTSVSLPSKYLFDNISMTNVGLLLTGEVAATAGSTSPTCAYAIVDSLTLRIGPIRQTSCDDPTLEGSTVGIARAWLPTDTNNVTIRVARTDTRTGAVFKGPVVMTYTHSSDTSDVTARGGGWLWIYDVATTNGSELLQVSTTTGDVVNRVAMPQIYRPVMAANDDGVWLGPAPNGGGPATLYFVGSRAKSATVIDSGHQSVCWLVASGHDAWAGTGCVPETIRRFHGTNLTPLFAVRDHGYSPFAVVGDETQGLWTMQWHPPLGGAISSPPRPRDIIRINPDTGAETVAATLPRAAIYNYGLQSQGLQVGQAAVNDGFLYLLEPPFRQGDYNGYSSLVRVSVSNTSSTSVPSPPPTTALPPRLVAHVAGKTGGAPPCSPGAGQYNATVQHPERAPLRASAEFVGGIRWAICGADPVLSPELLNLRSTNSGKTWTVTDTGLSLSPHHAGDAVIIHLSTVNTGSMRLRSPTGPSDRIYTTNDSGHTWQLTCDALSKSQSPRCTALWAALRS